jgi:hypothetical protein
MNEVLKGSKTLESKHHIKKQTYQKNIRANIHRKKKFVESK